MSPAAVVVLATLILSGIAPATQDAGPAPELRIDLGQNVAIEMVLIEPGDLTMGTPADQAGLYYDQVPPHRVKITRPFYLGATHVTQAQWRAVTNKNPSYFQGSDRLPVENVSWLDAQEFLKKLSAADHVTYRLPTEAEWEYACRAGTKTSFNSGGKYVAKKAQQTSHDLDAVGWYGANSQRVSHPVGQKKPNAWGLYDMHGNVWEWCEDWYGTYLAGAATNPRAEATGSARVLRGGSWGYNAGVCRAAFRAWLSPALRRSDVGFRVVLSAPRTP
jgi:formylglycine-generating enzyme required for sulfatase activity